MCDPTTIALGSLGLNAAGTILDFKAGRDEAAATRASATENLRLTYKDLGTRQLEEIQSATQQRNDITRQAEAAKGSAKAGAAGAGVSGVSVDLLVDSLDAEGARARDSVTQNVESTVAQLEREKRGALARAKSQINSAPAPSLAAAGLRLGSAGLQFAQDYRLSHPPTR